MEKTQKPKYKGTTAKNEYWRKSCYESEKQAEQKGLLQRETIPPSNENRISLFHLYPAQA